VMGLGSNRELPRKESSKDEVVEVFAQGLSRVGLAAQEIFEEGAGLEGEAWAPGRAPRRERRSVRPSRLAPSPPPSSSSRRAATTRVSSVARRRFDSTARQAETETSARHRATATGPGHRVRAATRIARKAAPRAPADARSPTTMQRAWRAPSSAGAAATSGHGTRERRPESVGPPGLERRATVRAARDDGRASWTRRPVPGEFPVVTLRERGR